MLCENCNKCSATTHIKRTVNGVTKEYYLCENCAQKLGFNSFSFFDTNNFFDSFFINKNAKLREQKVCDNCGSTYNEIVKSGRMGCAQCYKTFKSEIMPSLVKMQKSVEHIGSKPKTFKCDNSNKDEIADLEKQLKQAIVNEEYEKAAQLRDIIKEKRGEINE